MYHKFIFAILYLMSAIVDAKYDKEPGEFINLYMDPLPSFKPKLKLMPRIYGGSEAEPHSILSMAHLTLFENDTSIYYCGGSLISKRCVLTAAHCLEDIKRVIVKLGAHDRTMQESTQIDIESSDLIILPEWNMDEIINDVGIIILPKDVIYTPVIKCIALPSASENPQKIPQYAGDWGKVAGWGVTNVKKHDVQNKLLQAYLEIMSNDDCRSAYGSRIKNSSLCTDGSNNRGTCEGDSGGPLIVQNTQVGIISYGLKGCPPGSRLVFARVSSFLSFILKYCENCN